MAMQKVGPVVRARVIRRKSNRQVRWNVRRVEDSVSISRIIMKVANSPPSAVADHVKIDEWPRFSGYMVGTSGYYMVCRTKTTRYG